MSENKIKFKIITPEKITYSSEDVKRVTIPTEAGEITVLPNHIPLVSVLKSGELKIIKDKQEIFISVSTGFLEVRPKSEVYILADTAEKAEDIDLERAQMAKERVKQLLEKKQDRSDVAFARLQSSLNREMARIKVANKYRRFKKNPNNFSKFE
ncbi:ATP synthase F1 subunit epsilon [Patescibacteria group bacterium]|nr:ATP synthase F1 subunit epsilon [Patescibacteria group bacterium]